MFPPRRKLNKNRATCIIARIKMRNPIHDIVIFCSASLLIHHLENVKCVKTKAKYKLHVVIDQKSSHLFLNPKVL